MVEAYLAVGSNIEPHRSVPAAMCLLRQVVRITGVSTMLLTRPLARPEQAPYINGVWRVRTSESARALKYDALRGIEAQLGRRRTDDPHAARPIDLDVALYGDEVIQEPGLVVPDPDILIRPFLAIPLVELDPDIRLPGTGVLLAAQPVCRRGEDMTQLPELTSRLRRMVNL